MNICFMIDNIFPSHGGVGETTERFTKLLSQNGHNITIISSTDAVNKDYFQKIEQLNIYRLKGLKVPFTKSIYYQIIPSNSKIIHILKKEKIDLVILVSYTLFGIMAQRVCKNLKIPLLLWLHFQPENITKHIHLDFVFFRKLISLWIVFISSRSLKLVVPSVFAKNLFQKYGVKKEIDVISNGIDLKKFNSDNVQKGEFRKHYNLENKNMFLYVGRLMPEKNVDFLIDTFALLKKQDLVLVIIGKGDCLDALKKKVNKLNLNKQIIFTGWVDEKTKMQAYNDCNAFILPSLVELEGMVVLEAMSFGKPVFIANSPDSAARFLVQDGFNGFLFNPKNHQELYHQIISFIQDDQKQVLMGKESLKIVQNYNITKSLEEMDKVIKNLIVKK